MTITKKDLLIPMIREDLRKYAGMHMMLNGISMDPELQKKHDNFKEMFEHNGFKFSYMTDKPLNSIMDGLAKMLELLEDPPGPRDSVDLAVKEGEENDQ